MVSFLVIVIVGALVWHFYLGEQARSAESVADVELAAKKAEAIQSSELEASIEALERNDRDKVIWGDRFLRWTVLAYTIWRLDRGDQTIIAKMEKLLTLYYQHAWYPYVREKPEMPFPSLISYLRADGTWEDYWNDYKPVYVSAFILEYYLLATLDREWGTSNYPMLKNVTDSIIHMWLPTRHQPTAYVDAFKVGYVEVVEIKNITSSVDSAMVYSALVAASQITRTLGNDQETAKTYESYADDLLKSFMSEKWDWFPTNVLGSNPTEDYGSALQLGMTIPSIDGDDKIDLYAQKINSSLRLSPISWLLKWKATDSEPSSRSVYAAIGLAPRYPEMALRILISYAHRALLENLWFTSKTDGYEAEDPIWVSGKFLEAYVLFKQRVLFGRTIFSPLLLQGELVFQTSLTPGEFELRNFNVTFPNLYGGATASVQTTIEKLIITVVGFVGRNVSLTLLKTVSSITLVPSDIPASSRQDPAKETITMMFVPDFRPITLTIGR